MNYEEPRQVDPKSDRPDAGKWRWTLANRRTGTYATGGCGEWETCEKCGGLSGILAPSVECDCENGSRRRADACPGHDTAEEATEHHRQYLIDRARFRVLENPDSLHKCAICGQFTAGVMEIEGDAYYMKTVCEGHQTRETAEQLIGKQTWRMHS